MMLYRKFRGEWESSLKQRSQSARTAHNKGTAGADGVSPETASVGKKRPRSMGQSSRTREKSGTATTSSAASRSTGSMFGRSGEDESMRGINDVDVGKGGGPAAAAAVTRKKRRK